MLATATGKLSVIQKTKMHLEDILELLSGDKVVTLGTTADGYEFLLFYSFLDRSAKIAIVTKDRGHLITVKDLGVRLPREVRYPTKELVVEVKKLFKIFCFEKLKPEPPKSKENNLRVHLRIQLCKKAVVYETVLSVPSAGLIPHAGDRDTILLFKSEIMKILVVINESYKHPNNLSYHFKMLDDVEDDCGRRGVIKLRHVTLLKYLDEVPEATTV